MVNQLNESLKMINKWLNDPDEDQEFKDLVKKKFLEWYIENETVDLKSYPKLLEIVQEFNDEKQRIIEDLKNLVGDNNECKENK